MQEQWFFWGQAWQVEVVGQVQKILISFWRVAPARIYLPGKLIGGGWRAAEIQSKVQVLVFRDLDFATHEDRARAKCPTLA